MVGSIGEVLVAEHYGLALLPTGTETHDAISKDGKLVQIKATQTNKISISSEPEHGNENPKLSAVEIDYENKELHIHVTGTVSPDRIYKKIQQ